MFDPKMINDLVKQVMTTLPDSLKEGGQDIEKNIKAVVHTTFNRLDLVTREEFDIQSQVLLKTRNLLEQLEQRIELLEKTSNT